MSVTVASTVRAIRRGRADARRAWVARLFHLENALRENPTAAPSDMKQALERIEAWLSGADPARVWLTLGTMSGRWPVVTTVEDACRRVPIDGPLSVVLTALTATTRQSTVVDVQIVSRSVIADIGHLVDSELNTGIQRVARETCTRWLRDHPDLHVVGWTARWVAPRLLPDAERDSVLASSKPAGHRRSNDDRGQRVLLPWQSTYLVPELTTESPRNDRLAAMGEFSNNTLSVVGFDCVPITSAETTATDYASVFVSHLAAARHAGTIATISEAAAHEYGGWRTMLAGAGLSGPRIVAVPLAVEAPKPTTAEVRAARERFVVPGLPLVLCVGSHEPRKNHDAILHAARRCWRDGLQFSLVFIGGNAWKSEGFLHELTELKTAGLPVETATRVPDALLWAAYSLARFTVFPSFNEGFGLPVAESLAAGTPVITSNFGSMLEIARLGGAITVNPRDDDELYHAMRDALTDDQLIARLRDEAGSIPARTWDAYAAATWDEMVP